MDVENAARTGGAAQGAASVVASQKAPDLRILITEDDFASRKAIQVFLAPYGECFVAVNGFEVIEAFKDALDHGEPYDMICLDILMPEMNGHDALKAIRQTEQDYGVDPSGCVKVIMTTSKNSAQDIAEAFGQGCDAYIVKPVNREKLLAEMRKIGVLE